jgi:hypothetical protein
MLLNETVCLGHTMFDASTDAPPKTPAFPSQPPPLPPQTEKFKVGRSGYEYYNFFRCEGKKPSKNYRKTVNVHYPCVPMLRIACALLKAKTGTAYSEGGAVQYLLEVGQLMVCLGRLGICAQLMHCSDARSDVPADAHPFIRPSCLAWPTNSLPTGVPQQQHAQEHVLPRGHVQGRPLRGHAGVRGRRDQVRHALRHAGAVGDTC